jgi:N-acetylglucosamine-6-phosphate deacetylase
MPSAATRIVGADPRNGNTLVVEFTDGVITAVRHEPEAATAAASWLSSGLVDLQVNGFRGHDLNGPNLLPATVHELARTLLRDGVTTFLPTFITTSEPQLIAALKAVQQARLAYPLVHKMVPYVHVEGPSISPEPGPLGAHPLTHVRAPSINEFRRWQDASGDLVGLVTLSPHWPESVAYIRALTAAGVHVALGHTTASAEQISAAVDAGAVLSTHLGNGSHAHLHRRNNALWPQLANDGLCASFIADGHHLSPHLLKVMLRAKGLARSLIVSDVTAIGGMAPGHYDASVGGPVILGANGHLTMNDGTGQFLAGAALPLIAGVSTLVRESGLALHDALDLASANPGRWVGGRGRLEPGASADLIRFEWDGMAQVPQVTDVWLQGEQVLHA